MLFSGIGRLILLLFQLLGEIAREIRDAIRDRVAGYQVSAPFGIVDLALQVLE